MSTGSIVTHLLHQQQFLAKLQLQSNCGRLYMIEVYIISRLFLATIKIGLHYKKQLQKCFYFKQSSLICFSKQHMTLRCCYEFSRYIYIHALQRGRLHFNAVDLLSITQLSFFQVHECTRGCYTWSLFDSGRQLRDCTSDCVRFYYHREIPNCCMLFIEYSQQQINECLLISDLKYR